VTVAAGSSRFGTYLLARTRRGVVVFDDPAAEKAAASEAPLDRLPLTPPVRDALLKLGVATLGQFLELPPEGLAARFGPEVHRLHRLAAGELAIPLAAAEPLVPVSQGAVLEPPETDATRLLKVIEDLLRPLLDTLSRKAAALAELQVAFRFDRLGEHLETVRPAAPTLDLETLLELVRLRMEAARSLPDEVARVDLTAQPAAPAARQLQVLVQDGPAPRRDQGAAERALARVRARLGSKAVTRARLREGHLPEGQFEWVPFEALQPASPRGTGGAGLVRRLQVRPVPLPPRKHHEPDGWMLRGLEHGPVVKVTGPFIVSGGWWNRPVQREYHFAETQRGEILWVYYDRPRRRWYLQGRVE
jgi:protein ImuB